MVSKIRVTTRALALCAALALFVVAGLSYGQNNDASLSGTVTDTTGAAIPDANLTLTNTATGVSRTAKTDSSGGYNLTALQPGKYDLSVSAAGFKTTINRGIQLTISEAGTVNVSLPAGAAEQTITVQGGSSA